MKEEDRENIDFLVNEKIRHVSYCKTYILIETDTKKVEIKNSKDGDRIEGPAKP